MIPFNEKMKNKLQILTLSLFVFSSLFAQAQESTNASSGDATGSGGNVSCSVGKVVYTTNSGSNGSIAQGIQHAYEIFIVCVKGTKQNISLNAYPNPTADVLTLQISNYNNEK
jgi:hypothetical protein